MNKQLINLLDQYNIKPIYEINNFYDYQFMALGIGDILFTFTLILHNKINFPIIFNLLLFDNEFLNKNNKEIWFHNSLNALEFRIKLIKNIINSNKIEKNKIIFTYKNHFVTNSYYDLIYKLNINEYNLNINISNVPNANLFNKNSYYIFHTKCRFFVGYDYTKFKENLKNLILNFKTDKDIILLGEKKFNQNWEGKIHNTQTIYNELLFLKKNNNVIDLTIKDINDNLDFENYCHDIELIKNAYKNVIFGFGGQLSICLIFSIQNTFNFTMDWIDNILNPDIFENKVYFKDLSNFFNIIT